MLIGYARVSKQDQELRLQLDALTKAGCEKIYQDKASGKLASRPGLDEALAYVRPGDTLVVWKLDRLGRRTNALLELADQLMQRGVELQSITDGIDTKTPYGRFIFTLMSALAQMERELLVERTQAGLEAARRIGKLGGRRSVMTPAKKRSAAALMAGGVPAKEVAASIGVSVATLYRHLPAAGRQEDPNTHSSEGLLHG